MPFVQVGRNKVAGLITGAETKKYDSTGAVLWLASSTEAHSPTSTWFGSAAIAATMEAGFPSRSANILQFKSVYTTAMANFQWEEWGLHTATQSDSGDLLNKAVQQALGTKTCSAIWTITTCMTITT